MIVMLALFLLQNPGVSAGRVSGQIRLADGSAAFGVRVSAMAVGGGLSSTLVRITTSDASGRYTLEDVPPGRYYITAGLAVRPTTPA